MSKYTKQFKLAVVEHYLTGVSGLKEVAKAHGLVHSVVGTYVRSRISPPKLDACERG